MSPQSAIQAGLYIARHGYLGYLESLWHEQGDVAQIKIAGHTVVLAVHPDQVKQVTVDKAAHYDKVDSYTSPRALLLGNGLVTSTGPLWRRQRKLMAPFFTPTNVMAYADTIIAETNRHAERWLTLARTNQIIDITPDMMNLLARIVLKTMFSAEDNAQTDTIREAIDFLIGYIATQNLAMIRLPQGIPTAARARHRHDYALLRDYIDKLIQQRRQLPQNQWPDDILSRLLQAQDPETGETMSDQQVFDECVTLYAAGHETTARSLSFTWYLLAKHPEVAAQLHAEVDAVISGDTITHQQMKQMPYTMQVIKEALRLYPPAPLYIRDCVTPDQIGSLAIEPPTPVILSPYLTHRHPDFWPDPDRFDPDRWTPELERARHPYAFHAFAAGARICLGNNLSLYEGHIILSLLARRFNAELKPANHTIHTTMKGTLHPQNGIPMQISLRS